MPAARAWRLCETQWRTGFAGAIGLDYGACLPVLQLYLPRWQAEAPPDDPMHAMEVADLLDDLRLIEQTHLAVWAEKAERQREERERNT